MNHFTITFEQYAIALANAKDPGYRAHLVNDFRLTPDGQVMPRVTIDKVSDRCYILRNRKELFSSLQK